jgi:hypothetical protein
MKRGITLALVALAIAATVVIASLRHTEILEWKDVFQSRIVQVERDGVPAVRISGLCGHSAMSVRDINQQGRGSAQLVTVRIFLARRGTTGNFQVDVPVREDINEIRFGQLETVIWQRNPK